MATALDTDRLVRALLAERLAADPRFRQVLPLLGLDPGGTDQVSDELAQVRALLEAWLARDPDRPEGGTP